jgi:hypothetical protein
MRKEAKRASPFETLGAWLHIWTPPRDVEVPRVPWRTFLLAGVPALAVLVVGAWLVVENASDSNRERRQAEERTRAEQAAARRRELRAQQVPHRAQVEPAARPRLVRALEAAVLEDARSRGYRQRIRRVDCAPNPRTEARRMAERDSALRRGQYACLAVTNDIPGPTPGSIGYPFLGVIVYRTGSLVWCRVSPAPGEQVIPDPRTVVRVPQACR